VKKIYKKVLILCAAVLFGESLSANEQLELKEHFLNKINEVILVVEDKKISKNVRNGNIIKVLTPMFDFELMAKLSLGSTWKELSKENKDRFVKLYVERMKQSYSAKIDAYKMKKLRLKR
jgi:phospholipid transport system substrate-binding protein